MNECEYNPRELMPKTRDTSVGGYLKEIAVNTGSSKEQVRYESDLNLLKIIADNTALL